MRKLLAFLLMILVASNEALATTWNVNSTQSTSTIQGVINGASAGDTISFAAGTYSITGALTNKCGITYTGPAVTLAKNGLATPTAILSATSSGSYNIFNFYSTSGTYANPCTTPTTVQYLNFKNTGGIYVQESYTNITFQYNQYTSLPTVNGCYGPCTAIYFDGSQSTSNTAQTATGTLVQWNQFGDSNSCTAAMNDWTSADGDGLAQFCTGMQFNTSMNGVTIENNNFVHVSEGVHLECPGGGHPGIGPSPCEGGTTNGVIQQNVIFKYNDIYNWHRIGWEEQPQTTNGIDIESNSTHDPIYPVGFNFAWSFACCADNATSPYLIASNNVVIHNVATNFSGAPSGNYQGYGFEAWGLQAHYDHNLLQVGPNTATAPAIAYSCGPNATNSYNNIQGSWTIANQGYACPHAPSTPAPAMVGNTFATGTPTAVTSVTPSISPSSGAVSFPLTVTFTDAGYTGTSAQPLGNTGIWYTTDGTTPVPGSGTAQYANSGQTITLTSAATVKAVGMWGARNQPTSYASGYGFVPSSVVSNTYTGGGTPVTATPVFIPASSTYSGSQSVSVSDSTPASSIFCTTDGTTPTPSSPPYTAPFTFTTTTTLQCIATAAGYTNSSIASGVYTLAAAPTFLGGYQGNTTSANTLTVGAGSVQQIAYGNYSAPPTPQAFSTITNMDPYGNTAVWSSANPAILSVSSTGVVSCIAPTTGTPVNSQVAPIGGNGFANWGWTCLAAPSSSPIPIDGGPYSITIALNPPTGFTATP